jgi:NAD(P)-dependent dehydrogenase (short-subunit alcohol dehydrogenase family)
VGRFATGAPAAERAAPAADDDVRPRPSIPPEAVEAGAAEPAEPAGSFEARMLEPVPAWIPPSTAMGSVERTLSAGRGPVVVCGDGPLGEALRTHLAARSVTVVGAAEARSDEGAVQGVVLVDGGEALAAVPALGAHGRAVVEATTEHFELLRDLLSGGRLDPEGGFVLGITRMGGTFGLGETAPESASGGALAGLVKAYGSEHPGALAKVVDVDGRDDPDETARLLVEELEHDPMTREVGYRAGQRWGVTLEERDLPRAARPAILPERPVVMMTGGAGSIMVEIAERMASTLAARVVLTDILDPRAAEDAGAAERVLEAIERVEAAGGTALYVPADVTDEASVDRAVEEAVARFGRVDAVLHGAGMEESRALAKKSTETFRRIVSIKVAGAAHLVASVMRRARPRSFLFFSSVAGRFGNAGQADYSAGNDFMTRFAAALCERHPEVRFTAVDWTAWDGPGMAGDSAIRAVLEDAGIEVLDRAEGAEIACRVVAGRDPVGPEVVVARRLGVLEERIARAEGRTVALRPRGRHELEGSIRWSGNRLLRTFTVDPDRERWLWDHAVDGTPVFPAVMGLDAFLRTASALVGPELAAARIERSTFRRAVKFFEGKPRELRVVIEPEDAAGGDIRCSCVLDTENRNRIEGGRVIHFGAVVLLGTRPADPRPSAGSITRGEGVVIAGGGDLAGSSRDAAAAVYEHLFHGPGFQVLAGFHHGGRRFEVGVGELAGGGELAPAGVALLAEMGMQTAGMWLLRSAGLAALPAAIGTLHVLGDPSGVGPCRAVSVYRGRVDAGAEGVRHVFDVTIRDVASGRTVLWLESLALVQTTERPEARAGRPAPAGGPGAVVQDRRQ